MESFKGYGNVYYACVGCSRLWLVLPSGICRLYENEVNLLRSVSIAHVQVCFDGEACTLLHAAMHCNVTNMATRCLQ